MSTANRQRARRERIAKEQGRTIRPYLRRGERSQAEIRENKLERSRLERAMKASASGRPFKGRGTKVKFDAHVKKWIKWMARQLRKYQHDHDEHVRRYQRRIKNRAKFAERYKARGDVERERVKRYKAQLPDAYILEKLALHGFARSDVSPQLIELKRDQLHMRRLARQLKEAAHQVHKEEYESITKHT